MKNPEIVHAESEEIEEKSKEQAVQLRELSGSMVSLSNVDIQETNGAQPYRA